MTTVHLPAKRSKYRNVKTIVDGITFASKKEANRYLELKMLFAAGKIGLAGRQVKFSLDVNGVHICNYIADFRYLDHESNKVIVEDVKGKRTREYIIKKNLMLACHGIDVAEI